MGMVAPVAAVPISQADSFRVDAGGAESNVAAHVAALGYRARWVSRLGDDPLGHRVSRQLAARGVDVSAVRFDPEHRTGLYLKNPGLGVHYYRDGSAASHLDASDADAIEWDDIAIAHISGITAAISPSAALFLGRLIDRAHEANVPVSFDVNHRAALWDAATAAPVLEALARRADIVFVGRDEAETLWGTATSGDIHARFVDVAELVVKDGDIGATVFDDQTEVFVPALVVDVVEAVGAGDAFAGGYLASRLAGAPVADRLAAGHARAALTLQTTGDSVPDELNPDAPESEI